VWKATDRVHRRDVAVKMVRPELRSDLSLVRRFRREAGASTTLHHPNVVTTHETFAEGTGVFMVMELVEGSTLRQLLAGTAVLPPSRAVPIALQVAQALEYAHANGIVHRDVKPANILVDLDDEVKVADFGIAKAARAPEDEGRDMTESGAIVGTAKYLAPEQIRGEVLDGRADVYSLGIVLYEMLCGQPPFTGATDIAVALQHVTTPPVRPRRLAPGIPPALEAVVLRALAKDPAERFASASDMAEALAAIDLGPDDAVPLVVRDPTPPRGLPRPPFDVRRPPPPSRPPPPRRTGPAPRRPPGVGPRPAPAPPGARWSRLGPGTGLAGPPRPGGGGPGPAPPGPPGASGGPGGPGAGRGPAASTGPWGSVPGSNRPASTLANRYRGAEYWAPRSPDPPPRRRPSWLAPLILAVVVTIVLAVAGVLLATTSSGQDLLDDLLGRTPTTTQPAPTSPASSAG